MSIRWLARLLVLVVAACAATVGSARAAEPLVVNDTYWPPFFFGERPGNPPGFAREVLARCIPATGHAADFEVFPVSRMWAFMERGALDVNVMSFRDDRLDLVRYGAEPIFRAGYRLVVRADDPRPVASLADLAAHRVGHLRGLRYSDDFFAYLERQTERQLVRTVDSGELLLEALLEGKIDVFANHAASTRYQARRQGNEGRIRIVEDIDLKSADYFPVVSLASPRLLGEAAQREFLAALDACVAAGRETGWVRELETKYGLR